MRVSVTALVVLLLQCIVSILGAYVNIPIMSRDTLHERRQPVLCESPDPHTHNGTHGMRILK